MKCLPYLAGLPVSSPCGSGPTFPGGQAMRVGFSWRQSNQHLGAWGRGIFKPQSCSFLPTHTRVFK